MLRCCFAFPAFFFPAGDVGILSLSDSAGLQWLLPAGCPGLLLPAHRDQGPWPPGVQPQGMGPGDGGQRISFPRGITGMMGHGNLLEE